MSGRLSREIRVIVTLALSIIVMLGVYFYLHAYPSLTRLLVEESEADAVRAANVLRLVALGDQENTIRPDIESMDAIQRAKEALDVLKVKVFDPNGVVVHSSSPEDVGRVNENPYFREKIARGQNYVHLVRQNESTLEGEHYVRDVVETYVPIMAGDRFLGAFEIYYDITARRTDLDQRLRAMNLRVAALLAVLLMIFAFVVVRSYRLALRSERDYSQRLHDEIALRLETEEALRESHGRFQHMAHHDLLTGLPNRTLFIDRFEHALANARRYQTQMALLFIDLDHFKPINDTHGHEAGDRILKAAADVLERCTRESDTAARIAGDEFAVLIEHADAAVVDGVVRRLSAELANCLSIDELDVTTSASIGISIYPNDGDTLESLMHRADMAMYRAKAARKGGWAYYGDAASTPDPAAAAA